MTNQLARIRLRIPTTRPMGPGTLTKKRILCRIVVGLVVGIFFGINLSPDHVLNWRGRSFDVMGNLFVSAVAGGLVGIGLGTIGSGIWTRLIQGASNSPRGLRRIGWMIFDPTVRTLLLRKAPIAWWMVAFILAGTSAGVMLADVLWVRTRSTTSSPSGEMDFILQSGLIGGVAGAVLGAFWVYAMLPKAAGYIRFLVDGPQPMQRDEFLSLHASGRQFLRADLRGIDLSGTNLSGINFRGADLSGADLSGADLSEANLMEADLRTAKLRAANLDQANLREADLRRADLTGARLRRANLYRAKLYKAEMQEADLLGADLTEASLIGANLQQATLQKANFFAANLCEADLREADLQGAVLHDLDMTWTDLRDAVLLGADLRGTDLHEANLTGTSLRGVILPGEPHED